MQLITEHETSFIVMPKDCNWMDDAKLVFGGKMLKEMDLAAAGLIRKVLRKSNCDSAVTFAINDVVFTNGAKCGDLVLLKATLWNTGRKSIDIKIEGWIEKDEGLVPKCTGMFTWLSREDGTFTPHNLPAYKEGKLIEE